MYNAHWSNRKLQSWYVSLSLTIEIRILRYCIQNKTKTCLSFLNTANSEWLTSPEAEKQANLYFCSEKLSIWAIVADQVTEGTIRTKKLLSSYLEQQNKDICSQITGTRSFHLCLSISFSSSISILSLSLSS